MAHSMKVAWRLIAEIYCIDFYPTGKLVYKIGDILGTFVRDIRGCISFSKILQAVHLVVDDCVSRLYVCNFVVLGTINS